MANLTTLPTRQLTQLVAHAVDSPFAYGTGGNPAAWASSPAPSGYRWDFVTFNGERVTRSGEPVVSLVRIN